MSFIQLLSNQAVGCFVVRPHDTLTEQFFLSFVATAFSVGSQEAIKHAIIRKERIVNLDDRSQISYIFSCGKIGPSDSLMGILRYVLLLDLDI